MRTRRGACLQIQRKEKMNAENIHIRFRKQFDDKEWEKLNSHIEFKEALAVDDYDKAGLLADQILFGTAKSLPEAREVKKINEILKEFY